MRYLGISLYYTYFIYLFLLPAFEGSNHMSIVLYSQSRTQGLAYHENTIKLNCVIGVRVGIEMKDG